MNRAAIVNLAEQIIAAAGEKTTDEAPYLTPRECAALLPMPDAGADQRAARFEYLRRKTPELRTRLVANRLEVHLHDWRRVCAIERRMRRAEDAAKGF
jgi:hypothetical protein